MARNSPYHPSAIGSAETIKGFLLALLDCCTHHGTEHGVPASTIAAINQILTLAPEAVV